MNQNSYALFSTLQLLGNQQLVHEQLNMCFFNFAVEQTRSREHTRTSYTEYEVDALVLNAEEGRG